MRASHAAWAALAVTLLFAAGSCQRKPRFQPLKADSTASLIDSTVIHMRQVQDLWESGGGGERAASGSARILRERLETLPANQWKRYGDAFLDSLGIGYESAQGTCVLVVNFFARSDPSAGTWPYLYWCGEHGPAYQEIEGGGLHLQNVISRGFAGPTSPGPAAARGVATLFSRRGGTGQEPLLMTWSTPPGADQWRLVQTLGPDSLGGTGTGEFETPSDTTVDLIVRTYRQPAYFDECATCPHVYGIHRFRWEEGGFVRVEDTAVPSPYSTFVAFIQALMARDQVAASALVTRIDVLDAARSYNWARARGAWRIAPISDETPEHMEFYRGRQEAYEVHFQRSGDQWLISGIVPTEQTLE